jgi:DHA1 family multidrug/chloramphenicol efflux transport protein-like MFS transporter
MSWIVISPALMIVKYGYTPMQYALWQIPVFVAFTLGAVLTRPLIRRRSRSWVIHFFLVWAVCGALLLTAFSFTNSAPLLVGLVALTLFARGVTFAPMSRIALSIFTVKRGAATAMFYFVVLGTSGLVTLTYSALPNSFLVLGIALMLLSLISMFVNQIRTKSERQQTL